MGRALMMHPEDNVATVLEDVAPGRGVEVEGGAKTLAVSAAQTIPFGHKIALARIPSGAEVRKYGEVIGTATQDISAGAHVHVHNIRSTRG